MQRTTTLIDNYIQLCKKRDEVRYYFRDELYDEEIRNTYLNEGIKNLAEIFLFNPKKIDKEMKRFQNQPAEAKAALCEIAEKLAADPKSCRKDILYAIYYVFARNGKIPDCRAPLENLNLAQALCYGLDAFMKNYNPWIPAYQANTSVINFFANKNLTKCWRQFCSILLILGEMSTTPITVRFGWNSGTDTLCENDWQLLCRIMANTNTKLIIDGMNKLSDSSSIISIKKLKSLANTVAITQTIPTLREAASCALFYRAKIFRSERNDRFFIDVLTADKWVRQECTRGEIEFLEKTQNNILGRLSINRGNR